MRKLFSRGIAAALAMLAFAGQAQAQEQDAAWLDDALSVRKEIVLKPGAGGAGLDTKTGTFPFALRLSTQTLAFEDVKPDGSDLRVAGPDGERVDHYVENFDAKSGLATIWVKGVNVDPASSQTYHLYYGGDVPSTANPASIFDASEVLALDFSGGTGIKDRTRNNNSVTSIPTAAGFAGQSATFSGNEALRVAASSSLNIAGRPFTFMMWVKPTTASNGVLVDRAGSFSIALAGLTPVATVAGVQIAGSVQLSANSWNHIALVARADGRAELFVNGKPAGTGAVTLPGQAGDIVIGQGFTGQIDNVRFAAADRSPGYVNAVAQSDNGRGLVTFGAEQERSGKFEIGYFVTVIKSVTLEGWIVIAMCAVLLVLAIRVMVQKFGLLKKIENQNAAFEQAYAASPSIDGDKLGNDAKLNHISTLSQLYQAGLLEVSHRSQNGPARFSAAGIEALKARIDAVSSNQAFTLSDKLVILTLSIAGGPFLGLLGTVIGVMITFAAIAAEGNVNVNAIAPGVAAALLATAAGLAVAIPALFGYNLIVTRIKRINAANRSFADALVARIAEQYGA
jgi:biopolymer transport protein ExbB